MKHTIVIFSALLFLLFPQFSSGQTCAAGFTGSGYACFDPSPFGPIFSYTSNFPFNSQFTYQWGISGGTIVGGQGTGSINVVWGAPGMAGVSLTLYDNAGCYDTYSQQVVVGGGYASPVAGPDTVCVGDTVQFTNSWFQGFGGGLYYSGYYYYNGTIVGGGQSTVSATATRYDTLELVWDAMDTNAYVIFEYLDNYSFCTRIGRKDIVLLGAMRGPGHVCTGDTVQYEMLNGVNVNTWTVTGGVIVAGQGTNFLTVAWPMTGPGTVTCSWQCPSSGNETTTRNVNASVLIPPIITGQNPICNSPNGWLQYSVNGQPGHTYHWNLTNLNVVQGGTTYSFIKVVPDSNSIAIIEVTDQLGGCSVTVTDTLDNQLPFFDILGDEVLCEGASSDLWVSSTFSGASYNWVINGVPFTGQGNDSIQVTWPAFGQFIVEANVTFGGCSNTVKDTINVFSNPNMDLGPDIVYCKNQPPYPNVNAWNGYSQGCGNGMINSLGQPCNYIDIDTLGLFWAEETVYYGSIISCTLRDTIEAIVDPNLALFSLGPDTSICPGSSVNLSAGNTWPSYSWSTGSSASSISVNSTGDYSLATTSGACTLRDTINVSYLSTLPIDLGSDTISCNGSPITLDAGPGFTSYSWSTGATSQSLNAATSGNYSVTVVDGICTKIDSVLVTILSTPSINIGPDTTICPGDSLVLDAGPGFSTYTWNLFIPGQMRTVTGPGTYFVTGAISTCTESDTINVSQHPVLPIDLGPDTTSCNNNAVVLDAGSGFSSYSWSTGAATQSITTTANGSYSVTAVDGICTSQDDILVTIYPTVSINLGPDTVLCQGNSLILDAGTGFIGYSWSTGGTGQFLTVTGPGTYIVTGANGICTESDTIVVSMIIVPGLNLPPSASMCPDTSFLLDPGPNPLGHLWSTGAITQTIAAATPGLYWVEATGVTGCKVRDSVQVSIISDCVFPGDANHDGVANNFDLLNIGIAFSDIGPLRNNAVQTWYGQPAANWGPSFASGTNYKHADSDGNGVINDDDTLAILTNYGLTHTKTSGGGRVGVPLRLVPQQGVVYWGDTIHVDIELGDGFNPAILVYGLAFTTQVNPGSIIPGGASIAYASTFLGTKGSDLITLWQPDATPWGQDHALVRTDQVGVLGFGRIATVSYVVDSTAFIGQDTGYFPIGLTAPLLIDRFHTEKLMATQDTSVMILQPVVGLDPSSVMGLEIRPNPANQSSEVSLLAELGTAVTLQVVDLRGKILLEKSMIGNGHRQAWRVDTDTLSEGVYLVKVAVGDKLGTAKLMVQH